MANSAEPSSGRFPVELEDGREIVYYDPTEAVEEHAAAQKPGKTLGGLEVDEGEILEQDELGRTEANSSGMIVALAKRGQEEPFSHLKFPTVLPAVASTADEAMAHVRRYLKRRRMAPGDFLSFNVTTHYYIAPLGKRECGWSFSFEQKPWAIEPKRES